MSKNSIKINGDKLRALLEERTGLTIYQIAQSNGFSRNLIAESIRKEIASPIVQMIADKCGVNTEEYIYKEPITAPERTQISIDDLESIKTDSLKAIVKEALLEIINGVSCEWLGTNYDKSNKIYTLRIKFKED